MTATFDTTPFDQARADLRDLLIGPVDRWMALPPARRTETRYQRILSIPMDLAAAGYTVLLVQGDAGWHIELRRSLVDKVSLRMHGQAGSYVAALFQMATQAPAVIDMLQKQAGKAHGEALRAAQDEERAA